MNAHAGPDTPPPAAVAIDIGGTKITASIVVGPHVVVSASLPTPAPEGPDAVLGTAVRLARRVIAAAEGGAESPVAVGVGTAGVVDTTGRRIIAATSALPGWAGTEAADAVEAELGLPTTLLGDVQAFLCGELAAGAADAVHDCVAVMAGTGIGGAVAVGGRLLRGAHGAAGHLGHTESAGAAGRTCPCGAEGHVEAVASGPAMTAEARRLLPGHRIPDLQAVGGLARAGVPEAVAVLDAGGAALGRALAGVVSTLDPQAVVIGGGVLSVGPWYARALRAALAEHTLPLLRQVPVRGSALGGNAVLVGAAAQALAEYGRPVVRDSHATEQHEDDL